jgi:hypothetical protein
VLDLFGPRWHIGCSPTGLALVQRDRFGHHVGVAIERDWHAGTDPVSMLREQLHSALDKAGCAGTRATLVLSDDWCRIGIVSSASAMAGSLGTTTHDWVWQASAGQPCLAVAIPTALHTMLQDTMVRYRLRGVVPIPHCLVAWKRWHSALNNGDWFGIVHDSRITLISRVGKKMQGLMQQSLHQNDMKNPDWLEALVCIEAARRGLPLPLRIGLCGEVPEPWTVILPGQLTCVALREKKLPAGSLAVALAQAGIPA